MYCFSVVVVYRQPATSIPMFSNDFMSLSAYLYSLKSDFLLAHAFNIYMDTDSAFITQFKAIFDSCNMKQHVSCPSNIRNNTRDLVIT